MGPGTHNAPGNESRSLVPGTFCCTTQTASHVRTMSPYFHDLHDGGSSRRHCSLALAFHPAYLPPNTKISLCLWSGVTNSFMVQDTVTRAFRVRVRAGLSQTDLFSAGLGACVHSVIQIMVSTVQLLKKKKVLSTDPYLTTNARLFYNIVGRNESSLVLGYA